MKIILAFAVFICLFFASNNEGKALNIYADSTGTVDSVTKDDEQTIIRTTGGTSRTSKYYAYDGKRDYPIMARYGFIFGDYTGSQIEIQIADGSFGDSKVKVYTTLDIFSVKTTAETTFSGGFEQSETIKTDVEYSTLAIGQGLRVPIKLADRLWLLPGAEVKVYGLIGTTVKVGGVDLSSSKEITLGANLSATCIYSLTKTFGVGADLRYNFANPMSFFENSPKTPSSFIGAGINVFVSF